MTNEAGFEFDHSQREEITMTTRTELEQQAAKLQAELDVMKKKIASIGRLTVGDRLDVLLGD